MIAVLATIASASCYRHANGGRGIYDISAGCDEDEDDDDAGHAAGDDDNDGHDHDHYRSDC